MASVDTTFDDHKATAEQVRAHAEPLRAAARGERLGLVGVLPDGTVVVHTDEPGYRPVFGFVERAHEIVGHQVHVVTDDVPAASGARPL